MFFRISKLSVLSIICIFDEKIITNMIYFCIKRQKWCGQKSGRAPAKGHRCLVRLQPDDATAGVDYFLRDNRSFAKR